MFESEFTPDSEIMEQQESTIWRLNARINDLLYIRKVLIIGSLLGGLTAAYTAYQMVKTEELATATAVRKYEELREENFKLRLELHKPGMVPPTWNK